MDDSESSLDAIPTPVPASSPLTAPPASSPVAVDDPIQADASNGDEDSEPVRPMRAPKGKRRLAARESPPKSVSNIDEDDNSEYEASPPPKKKAKAMATSTPKSPPKKQKKRKSDRPINRGKAIPRCYDECEDLDKMLLDWHEQGKPWDAVRKEWTRRTGEKSGNSTLPDRYIRLKANFTVINEADHPTLLLCKQEVEARFEADKWILIAKAMKARDTEAYSPETLQCVYKKLMLSAANIMSGGNGEVDEEEVDDGDEDVEGEENA